MGVLLECFKSVGTYFGDNRDLQASSATHAVCSAPANSEVVAAEAVPNAAALFCQWQRIRDLCRVIGSSVVGQANLCTLSRAKLATTVSLFEQMRRFRLRLSHERLQVGIAGPVRRVPPAQSKSNPHAFLLLQNAKVPDPPTVTPAFFSNRRQSEGSRR